MVNLPDWAVNKTPFFSIPAHLRQVVLKQIIYFKTFTARYLSNHEIKQIITEKSLFCKMTF